MEKELQESPDMFFDSQDQMDVDVDESKESTTWRGTPMSVIYRGVDPWIAPEFPPVAPGYRHAVLYHVPYDRTSVPVPQRGKDIWDKDHVRMPCSPQSLYPVEENGKTVLKNRWQLIVDALVKPIKNSKELEAAILSYNSKYRNIWKFKSLHKLFCEYLEEEESEYFFQNTLPKIQNLVLELPEIIPNAIPLLRQTQNKSISLSQWQIACLLANAFFCTFPRRNSRKTASEYSTFPDINFNRLFQVGGSKCVLEKIKCICHYFRRVLDNAPIGVITFTRRCVEGDRLPKWSNNNTALDSVPLHVDSKGTIEDEGLGLLQVDFANRYLGGGVLGHGCVQEEIRFVICPELLVSMLFTESLKLNEAFLIIGCERFSNYKGYSGSFRWESNHRDTTPRDSSGRLRCAVIAIDAVRFTNKLLQYQPGYIARELNKAFTGYSIHMNPTGNGLSLPGVATGNWGCGAYRGSPHLKALIQLMACGVSCKPMVYFTFGNIELRDDIVNMYNFLSENKITIGELHSYLCEFHKSSAEDNHLYPFILQIHKDKQRLNDNRAANKDYSKLSSIGLDNHPEKEGNDLKNMPLDNASVSSVQDNLSKDYMKSIYSKTEGASSSSRLTLFDAISSLDESKEHKVDELTTNSKIDDNSSDFKLDVSNVSRKSGKISDYFQPLQRK